MEACRDDCYNDAYHTGEINKELRSSLKTIKKATKELLTAIDQGGLTTSEFMSTIENLRKSINE